MDFIKSVFDFFSPSKKHVFISYQHDIDNKYKNLLRAWNSNSRFDFEFEQCSPTVAIDSKKASKIKKELLAMIKDADYLMVIIGEYTYTSEWVAWEIRQAKKEGLKLIAVKIDRSFITPSQLLRSNTNFAYSFTMQAINDAIDR